MDAQQTAEDVVARFLAKDVVAQRLGVTTSDVAPGAMTCHMTVTEDMVNGHGSAHGSVLFALADIAFGMACNSYGHLAVGRSTDMEFLAPAFPGDAISARATERARAERTGIYDVAVTRDGDGVLLAELRAVSRRVPGPPQPSDAQVP